MSRSSALKPRKARTGPASSRVTRIRRRLHLPNAPWGRIALITVAVVAAVWAGYRWIDFSALRERIVEFNGPAFFAILVLLPLVGFPVRLLHIAAGIRFGVGWGMVIVSLSILLQLLASHAIVRQWGDRLERTRWVTNLRARVPHGARASVSVIALLIPGAPYMAVNYALPLMGVPLRTFLLCAWPLHTLRSTVSVVFGDQSDDLTLTKLALILGYALLLFGASWWTYRRMRSRS